MITRRALLGSAAAVMAIIALSWDASAQVAPSAAEMQAYRGLHAAAQRGDVAEIRRLAVDPSVLNARDARGRAPLHVATFARQPRFPTQPSVPTNLMLGSPGLQVMTTPLA